MRYLVLGSLILTIAASLSSSGSSLIKNVAALTSAPNGTYQLEGEAVLNKNQVIVTDGSGSIESTCGNLIKGCAGAGILKLKKQGSAYSVLDINKRPTTHSLNKIEDVEVMHDSLIRILIKDGEWIDVPLNKSNVKDARGVVKNKSNWAWDSNTQSLIKSQ